MSCVTQQGGTGSVETGTLVADVINAKEESSALAERHVFPSRYSKPIQETGSTCSFLSYRIWSSLFECCLSNNTHCHRTRIRSVQSFRRIGSFASQDFNLHIVNSVTCCLSRFVNFEMLIESLIFVIASH